MNRSFRAQESKMQGAWKRQFEVLKPSSRVNNDNDDELALFLEMRRREKEHSNHGLADAPLGSSNQGSSAYMNIKSSAPAPGLKTGGVDDFLNFEDDKNDYEWLLSPPGSPLFPSLEMETQKTVTSQLGAPTTRPTALKSRLANPPPELVGRNNLVSNQPASSPGLTFSGGGTRRPSLSGNPGPRPATPTRRPTLTPASKSTSSTPTSRPPIRSTRTTVSTTKPVISATKSIVSVTKSTTVPAAKPTVPARSSTPLSRSTARSSTPTSRPALPASRSTSRAATPTRRPSIPSNTPTVSSPLVRTSSIPKPTPAVSRQPVPSPTVRLRPWQSSEMPGFSLDAPPNLRTKLPERPLSTTRGRPGGPTSRSSSVEPASGGRPKRQSCSPSRGRSSNGISRTSGSSMPAVNRGYSKVNDNVSPVAMGTKMVERVINMRKLAPSRLDVKTYPHSNLSAKSSSSPDNSGFGRTLSKKSLDMAIRHMDLRQRVPGNLRPLMAKIPASSMYSVRSGPQRSRTVSVSGSPHATSSNAGSEVSVNQNGHYLDNNETDDDIISERGGQSPYSLRYR